MTDTKTITDGNGTTHLFDVAGDIRLVRPGNPPVYLPGDTIGRTMLFVPQAVSVAWQAPMVIYYHGHHGPALIDDYITEMPERDFRPLLKSLKVVLVEPQGGRFRSSACWELPPACPSSSTRRCPPPSGSPPAARDSACRTRSPSPGRSSSSGSPAAARRSR